MQRFAPDPASVDVGSIHGVQVFQHIVPALPRDAEVFDGYSRIGCFHELPSKDKSVMGQQKAQVIRTRTGSGVIHRVAGHPGMIQRDLYGPMVILHDHSPVSFRQLQAGKAVFGKAQQLSHGVFSSARVQGPAVWATD